MTDTSRLIRLAAGTALVGALMGATPAFADDAAAQDAASQPAALPTAPAAAQPAATPAPAVSGTDIFSRNTFSALVDLRLAVANGDKSFVNGGFGKTRFQGSADGGYRAIVAPMEADVVWNPRFTSALSANISAAYQRGHDGDSVDLMEAFFTWLPAPTGKFRFSGRAGLMWPEISLEHSTGGAWSVVNTITPSAINSWVGEEVKVVGAEGTVRTSIGDHDLGLTGAVFGWNDTSGTLISFRGWALQDIKATALGSFGLPPLNKFITTVQQNKTDNTIEIDKQPGYYVRLDWRPPAPFTAALFYYDNRGDPQAVTPEFQWGWRTRFWNLGINAKVAPGTRILIQGMTGSTIMGYPDGNQRWVHTDFTSAYLLAVHDFGKFALTGRIEGFKTREHGADMAPNNSEDGWALTGALRVPINRHLTSFAEVLHVESTRGTRVTLAGLPSPFDSQTVFQLALRARL